MNKASKNLSAALLASASIFVLKTASVHAQQATIFLPTGLPSLGTISSNSYLGNIGNATGAVAAAAFPNCNGNTSVALQYGNGTGVTCVTITASGGNLSSGGVLGTANQITATGGLANVTLSIPAIAIFPGNIATTAVANSTAARIVGGTIGGNLTTATANISCTWNSSGIVDACLFVNAGNTSSAAQSKVFDFQFAGATYYAGDNTGSFILSEGGAILNGNSNYINSIQGAGASGLQVRAGNTRAVGNALEYALILQGENYAMFSTTTRLGWGNTASATFDTGLVRASAGVINIGNGTIGDVSGRLQLQTVGNLSLPTATGDFICVTASGNMAQGVTTCAASDRRVKNDLGIVSPAQAVARVMALPEEHRFTYKTGYGPSGDHAGWFAQDIARMWPGVVYRSAKTALTPDGELTFDRAEVGPDTTTAVKWLIQHVREQDKEIAALRARLRGDGK